MASSDHMASVDPWIFSRSSIGDPWFTETFSRDTEILTRALQRSISSATAAPAAATTATTSNNSNNSYDTLTPDVVSPFLKHHPDPAPSTPSAVAASLGSDQEAPASKRQRVSIPGASGKVSKRKSRASKRSQTTYITADPANFRQMVQQVTGARFVGAGLQVSAPILKPEPQRPGGGRLIAASVASGCLPTLDTSAFLLDRHAVTHSLHHQHQQQQQREQEQQEEMATMGSAQTQLSFLEVADVGGGPVSGGGYDFGSFAGFPTLESWTANAM